MLLRAGTCNLACMLLYGYALQVALLALQLACTAIPLLQNIDLLLATVWSWISERQRKHHAEVEMAWSLFALAEAHPDKLLSLFWRMGVAGIDKHLYKLVSGKVIHEAPHLPTGR